MWNWPRHSWKRKHGSACLRHFQQSFRKPWFHQRWSKYEKTRLLLLRNPQRRNRVLDSSTQQNFRRRRWSKNLYSNFIRNQHECLPLRWHEQRKRHRNDDSKQRPSLSRCQLHNRLQKRCPNGSISQRSNYRRLRI